MFKFLPIDSAKCLKRPRTVGNGVFLLRRKLGIGLFKLRQVKYRVVAEAAHALGREQNLSGAFAARDDPPAVRPEAGNDADEFRRAPLRRNVLQIFKQIGNALRVGAFMAVAGGVHARRAVQRVHHETGIIGQNGHTAGLHDGLRLQKRVFFKRRARLVDIYVQPVFRFQSDLKAELGQNRGKLDQLVLVLAG